MNSTETPAQKKSLYTLTTVRYGMTNFFSSLVTTMASAYFAVFLTGSIGLSAAAMGSILALAGLVDTMSVPCIAIIIQKATFKSGKFRPWLLFGGSLCALFSWLRFTDIGVSAGGQAFYFGLMYVLCYIAFNFAYSAYTGIMPLLAKDPEERVGLASCRIQFNSISKFILGLVSVQMIAFFSGGKENATGYSIFAAFLGVLVFLGFYQLYRLAKPIDVPADNGNAATATAKSSDNVSILEMIQSIISLPMLLYLIAAILKIGTFFSVTSIAAYYYNYVIGNRALLTVFLSGSTLLMFCGALITPWVARLVGGARNTYICGGIIYGGAMLISYFAKNSGMTFTTFMCLGYVGYSFMHASEAAVYSTLVDYTQFKTGKDLKGFLMSIFTLSPKVGSVLQGVILGIGLTTIGFTQSNLTKSAIQGIPVLMSLLPAILMGITVVCMSLFPLTDQKVREMQAAVNQLTK
jgi:Na+/melibiose symporter-like transporter